MLLRTGGTFEMRLVPCWMCVCEQAKLMGYCLLKGAEAAQLWLFEMHRFHFARLRDRRELWRSQWHSAHACNVSVTIYGRKVGSTEHLLRKENCITTRDCTLEMASDFWSPCGTAST